MEVGEMEFHIHPHDPCTVLYVLAPTATIPHGFRLLIHPHARCSQGASEEGEGGGIYCLGSGEPWKLHYDIKGAAAPAAGPGTRLRLQYS